MVNDPSGATSASDILSECEKSEYSCTLGAVPGVCGHRRRGIERADYIKCGRKAQHEVVHSRMAEVNRLYLAIEMFLARIATGPNAIEAWTQIAQCESVARLPVRAWYE